MSLPTCSWFSRHLFPPVKPLETVLPLSNTVMGSQYRWIVSEIGPP